MDLSDPILRAKLDPYLRKVNLYSAYTLSEREFIGRADASIVDWLDDHDGFSDPPTLFGVPLEAAKFHWSTGDLHDLSCVFIDPRNERKWFHIHGFRHENGYDIASHHEYRADLKPVAGESPAETIARLRTHYRPGRTYKPGEAPEAIYPAITPTHRLE